MMAIFVPAHCWMARTALGWCLSDLARAAAVSAPTVRRFESGEALKAVTVETIQRALEKAGVIFIDANDGGPGVRLASSGATERSGSVGQWPSRLHGRHKPVACLSETVTESKAPATAGDEVVELRRRVDELRKRLELLNDQRG
jgi:transcriptional regulator with XRE-family HTH domain